jgi:hypothetical protein
VKKTILMVGIVLLFGLLVFCQQAAAGDEAVILTAKSFSVNGEQAILQTERSSILVQKSAVPIIIEFSDSLYQAVVRGLPPEPNLKKQVILRFSNRSDFRSFGAFVKKTSCIAGGCFSGGMGGTCIVYVFSHGGVCH